MNLFCLKTKTGKGNSFPVQKFYVSD